MIVNVYLGEIVHNLKSGRARHFAPTGECHVVALDGSSSTASERRRTAQKNPIERLSSGGYAARVFVGLNVGAVKKWAIDDVIRITYEIRVAQNRLADASILAQHGIYTDRKGERVVEPSVQIVIIDIEGLDKKTFVDDMKQLAETLREKLEQETVILEIQKSGVVEDVYSVTA